MPVRSASRPSAVAVSLAFIYAVSPAGCATDAEPPAAHVSFEALFDTAGVVRLEEREADVRTMIVGVEALALSPAGELAVVDPKASRVRLFDGDGRIRGTVGRYGEGPGELKNPGAAAYDGAGRLYVADRGNGRVNRYGADLRYDTSFITPGYHANELHVAGDSLLCAISDEGGPRLALMTGGRLLASYHPMDSATYAVPYLGSTMGAQAAVSGDTVYVATNVLYPLHRYTLGGTDLGTFGYPPPSWVPARHPALGEFVDQDLVRADAWLSSFTFIMRLAVYRDSLLLVVHGRIPGWFADAPRHEHLDVYDRSGRKLYEDVPMPGRLLTAGDYAWFLIGEPPGPWTLGRFSIRQREEVGENAGP